MPNLRSGNKNGQTHEGADQSDNDQLEQDNAADALAAGVNAMALVTAGAAGGAAAGFTDMAIVTAGAAGGAAGGVVRGGVVRGGVGAQSFPSMHFDGRYRFGNIFITTLYNLKYDLKAFKKTIMRKKILGVDGTMIFTDRSSTAAMTVLFSNLFEQYSYEFTKFVFRTSVTMPTESPETLKNRADAFHAYLFGYIKTIPTMVIGGSSDYQNFRNKIVIPTMLYAYNLDWPIVMLPNIDPAFDMGLDLVKQYFEEPNPILMEQNQAFQLPLGA